MLAKSSQILSANAQSGLQCSHPSELSSLQQKPLSSLRPVFGQWIRSMVMQERFVAVKVHLPEAIPLVKLIFSKTELPPRWAGNEQRGGHLLDSKKFARKYEKNFYESLIFVSDGHCFLDHICFDFSLMECPEKLFDLFMSPSQTLTNRTLLELIKARIDPSSLNQRSYKLASKEKLSYQLFLFLRQQVLINFLQSQQNNEIVAKKLEEEKKRKKEFNNNWKVMSQDMKQKFLLLGHPHVEALREWLNDKEFPIKTSELEKEIQDLLKLEKNDFCNRIFNCKLRKVLSPLLGYYEHIYHQWKNDIEKFRKKRNTKSIRNERDYSSQHKKVQNKESSKQHNRKYKKSRKANSVESNQTNQTEDSKVACLEKRQSDCEYNEPVNKKNDLEPKVQDQIQFEDEEQVHQWKQHKGQTKIEFNPQKQLPQLLQTPKKPISISSTSTKISSKNSQSQLESEKPQQDIDFLKQISLNKLNQQLEQIADRISQEANEFHDRRVIAFQRIQFLLQYYNVPIKLFGSCASGIAIRNSDIDIAIDNSILNYMDFLPEPERIKAALERLEELFWTQPWITQIKFIKTAAIPLIKLTIDTSLSFLDFSIGQMYYQLNRAHNSGPINADITVETKNKSEQCSHLGLISTNAINKWLSEISSLHSIIIILKEFFAKRKLNCTYEGGLNTFSMIVLMVAYIFHTKLEEEENAALVFERILRFYAEEFNERERGIDILNNQSNNIFYIKNLVNVEGGNCKNGKQKADLQIKDPMNQQKNMTRNCYSFHAIKNLFKDMLQCCFDRGYKELQDIANINESKLEPKSSIKEINREVFSKRNVFIQFLDAAC